MKRIKYTNTGITPLKKFVAYKGDSKYYGIEDENNRTLFYIQRIRNHSKNDTARCAVFFDGKEYMFNVNCDTIITCISNSYLFWNLFYKNTNLMYKFFGSHSGKCPFVIDSYICLIVIQKLKKEGFFNEKE